LGLGQSLGWDAPWLDKTNAPWLDKTDAPWLDKTDDAGHQLRDDARDLLLLRRRLVPRPQRLVRQGRGHRLADCSGDLVLRGSDLTPHGLDGGLHLLQRDRAV
jgi:hypothetical protein